MLLLDDSGPGASSGSGDLLAHWKLNEGSGQLAEDASSYQYDANVLCVEVEPCIPSWVSGKLGSALQFNGSSDYVSLPYQSLHNRGDITLSLWFKTLVNDRYQTLLSGMEQFNGSATRLMLSNDNRIYYYTGDRSWDYEYWNVPPFSDDQWHHLAIVRNDTLNEVTLYLDGASYGKKFTGMDLIDIEPESLILGLEQKYLGGAFRPDQSLVGEIDDVKFVGRALPRHEVELSYENRDWNRVSAQIDRSSDDADSSSSTLYLTDWDLDIHQYDVGLRFNQIGVPPGASIEKAYVEFRSNSTRDSVVSVPVFGELTANAETFSSSNPITGRAHTNASLNWDSEPWSSYQSHRTTDLSSIIQEITDQNNWALGNSLALLFEQGAGTNSRAAVSYDYQPENAARLIIYYSGGNPDASPPDAPANLQATPSSTAILLSWDHANDEQSGISYYTIYRQKSGQPRQNIATLEKLNLPPMFTDTDLEAGVSYSYSVTATNNADLESNHSSPAVAVAQSASSSYAHWPLNESSGLVAADIGPNQHDGLLVNGPEWTASGQNGGALRFDGDDDRIDLPYTVLNGAKSVSISLWLKTSKAGEQALVSGANLAHNNAFLMMLDSSEKMKFYTHNDSTEWEIDAINDNQWHHVLFIANDATNGVSLYIDGIFQGAERITINPLQIDEGGLVIGQEQDSVGGNFDPDQAFHGELDEIRIEQRVLSWVEIQNQVILDSSPPTIPGSLSATASDGALVNLSWAAASDGETDICKYRIYRGTSAGNESFLFEVGNVTEVVDAHAANNSHYRYRVSAENCVAMEGGLSNVATIDTQSDTTIGLQAISAGAWDEAAVRRVLNIFAYGGHTGDAQTTQWANMNPEAAIIEMLTFGKTNALLSPPEDASAQHAESLLALQTLWGGEAADNPMRWDKREDYHPLYFNSSGSSSVSYSNLERAWTQAIATRGLNPFLHKMAFFLSNYQMSISQFKTRSALIRDYYDTLLEALSTQSSFVDVINAGAKHAAVAKAYDHDDNSFYNDTLEFEGNDDFAREYFQLFFAIQGETEDAAYHEGITIENNAMLLTGMELDRKENAFDSDDSNDWDIAPITFNDHIDSTGDYIFNQSNHHGNCLEILHEVVCGASASEKLDALSPIAANHAESLANLPIFIINLFADDNLTPEKERAIQAQWREANFDLLTFLRSYAISTIFHRSDTFKYLTSFDRSLMLFNRITLDNDETFLGLNYYENAEDWLDYQGLNPFNPTHDVFGHQTGLEAANNPNIFKQNYIFEINRNTLQKTAQLYYLDDTEIDATTWYKDWGGTVPGDGSGNYIVADVADWLWNHLIGDGGKNFDIIAKSQVYALLARGDDFGYVAVEEGAYGDRAHAFTSNELTGNIDLADLLASLGAETLALGSTDIKGDRRDANTYVGQAVQFIAMLPYTFVVEGQ